MSSLVTDDVASLGLLCVALLVAFVAAAARACYARSPAHGVHAANLAVPLLEADVEVGERPVQHSVRLLGGTVLGEADLSIDNFAEAGVKFCDLLEKLGPFKMILNDVRSNLKKIQRTPYRPAGTVLMRALLEAECTRNVHTKPGRLDDKSAATGLLWTCRFMRFWEKVRDAHRASGQRATGSAEAVRTLAVCRCANYHSTTARWREAPCPFRGPCHSGS